MKMKKIHFIMDFKDDIEFEKGLTDAECRLWHYLKIRANYIENGEFGSVPITYEEIMADLGWCKGKVSKIVNGLELKKIISGHWRKYILINNPERFIGKNAMNVRKGEQLVHEDEQAVHINEHNVHENELKNTN